MTWERSYNTKRTVRSAVVLVAALFMLSACRTIGHADGDMDEPLAKSPRANLPSVERRLRAERALRERNAVEAPDPSVLRQSTLNTFRSFSAGDPIKVHALNVGAGMCVAVECPGSDDVLLYDCGSSQATDVDLDPAGAADYLRRLFGEAEPIVVLSHAHTDHVNLIPRVMGQRKARSIWFGGLDSDYGRDIGRGVQMDDWLQAQSSADVPLYYDFTPAFNNSGEAVAELACGDAETFILSANGEPDPGSNDNERMHANSLMLLIRYGEFKVVLTGDAVGAAERAALKSYRALLSDATVVFASHHGARSNDSNSEDWVRVTRPLVVVYSADTKKGYGHPKGEIVDRYRYTGTLRRTKPHAMWFDPEDEDSPQEQTRLAEYVTELNGAVVISSDGSSNLSVTCSRDATCW